MSKKSHLPNERAERSDRWTTPRLVRAGGVRDIAGSGTARDQGNGKNQTNRS
ncbi:hypothetical protein [Paraurantiacibacter namhicola]|uniref:Uncharacterized protein n=1 Tax=Paraurantiacibacter namhicola TaxID=645517 RepID=A0A1C7D5X8_9SPHN|nr:hypothetical protein [Paraurantiacibacter namhicola]ANU06858.1 hypothetical protein A6F65_00535 [Paraurantiacibacter namhicola]